MDEKGTDNLVIRYMYYGKAQNVCCLYMMEEFPTDVNFSQQQSITNTEACK